MPDSMYISIGIDPDVTASGVAIYEHYTYEMTVKTMPFWELCMLIMERRADIYEVSIEAGWLNAKSNYHKNGAGERVAARIGKNVGANHQTGKLIVELLEHLKMPFIAFRPNRKKMTAVECEMLTGIKTRNQDKIDAVAALLRLPHVKVMTS